MNPILINRLQVLAETKSFTKAAECLFVSRPALTRQISELEKELGFRIFERTYEGIVPTKVGSRFLAGLKEIDDLYEELLFQCREEAGCLKNSLVIGTLSNFPSILIPGICMEFKKMHPETQLIFKDYSVHDFFRKLTEGSMDLTVEYLEAYYHISYSEVETFHLMDSKYHCGVSVNDPLAEKKVITFEDLRGRKLMMYRKGISVTDDLLRSYLIKHEPEITIYDIDEYSSSLANYCQIENVVILFYANHQGMEGVKTIPTNWDYQIPFGLAYRKPKSKLIKEFLKAAKKYMHIV